MQIFVLYSKKKKKKKNLRSAYIRKSFISREGIKILYIEFSYKRIISLQDLKLLYIIQETALPVFFFNV